MTQITISDYTLDVPQDEAEALIAKYAKRELMDEELLTPVIRYFEKDRLAAWFTGKEDAAYNRIVAFAKMRAVADRLNEGKTGRGKFTFYFDYVTNRIKTEYTLTATNGFTFHTSEDRDRFVRLLEPEIRVFLGVSQEGK